MSSKRIIWSQTWWRNLGGSRRVECISSRDGRDEVKENRCSSSSSTNDILTSNQRDRRRRQSITAKYSKSKAPAVSSEQKAVKWIAWWNAGSNTVKAVWTNTTALFLLTAALIFWSLKLQSRCRDERIWSEQCTTQRYHPTIAGGMKVNNKEILLPVVLCGEIPRIRYHPIDPTIASRMEVNNKQSQIWWEIKTN